MKIYLDFDGTVVEHAYPRIGRANFGCVEIIRRLQDAGHEIVLNTYRADCANGSLENAINYLNNQIWFALLPENRDDERFHPLPITEHTRLKIHPPPWEWDVMHMTGEIYIDDCAGGIPLKPQLMTTPGNMVDWDKLNIEFEANGIY